MHTQLLAACHNSWNTFWERYDNSFELISLFLHLNIKNNTPECFCAFGNASVVLCDSELVAHLFYFLL